MATPRQTVRIEFRVTQREAELLDSYCNQEGMNRTDVLRECIRKLRRKVHSPGVSQNK